jgi:hypothetical protein
MPARCVRREREIIPAERAQPPGSALKRITNSESAAA